MSSIRMFALIAGAIYGLLGLLGLIPALVTPPEEARPLAVDTGYGYLFGLFPVNIPHNFVHIAAGAWGIVASRTIFAARFFARAMAVIFGLLTVMGLIPGLDTTFGLVPIFGHDIWLHALLALGGAYFGWVARIAPAAAREDRDWRQAA